MKNRVLTKVIAMVLAAMTVLTVMSAGFTASAMDMENAGKKAASAVIITGAGKIPVVGSFVSKALDPILSELFGIKSENEQILKKLEEISTKLDELKTTLDRDTQEILKNLSSQKRDDFNKSMTNLRNMISKKYVFLKNIEDSDYSDYEKALMTAEMLNFSMDNAGDLEIVTETLTDYVKGTEFKSSNTDNIYDYVYCASCDGSVLGSEAAIKAGMYINSVNEIITASYKLMALVLGEKIYVSDNYNDIMNAAETDAELKSAINTITSENLAKYRVKIYRNYWTELLSDNAEGYEEVFSLDNSESVVSKYNNMVLDNWFEYIKEVRYSADSITVSTLRLNSEMSYTTPVLCGLEDYPSIFDAQLKIRKVTDNVKKVLYSALTKAELQKLYEHIVSSELLSTDENGNRLSLYDTLKELGFTFNGLEKEKAGIINSAFGKFIAAVLGGEDNVLYPVFAYEASCKIRDFSPLLSQVEASASYTGYYGLDASDSAQTVKYYNMHYVDGRPAVDKAGTANVIMYFTAA